MDSGLSCALTTLLNITIMWTVSGQGAANLSYMAVTLFSGMIVPIPFFPEWAQTIINVLPFRGLLDTPYRLYLGHIPTGDLLFPPWPPAGLDGGAGTDRPVGPVERPAPPRRAGRIG